jgi:hypothetical protein
MSIETCENELLTYFSAHKTRYKNPALYTFTQVFFNPDQRDKTTLVDAEAIKLKLIEQGDTIENAGALGDNFMMQSYNQKKNLIEVQKLFGGGFAQSLIALQPRKWHIRLWGTSGLYQRY